MPRRDGDVYSNPVGAGHGPPQPVGPGLGASRSEDGERSLPDLDHNDATWETPGGPSSFNSGRPNVSWKIPGYSRFNGGGPSGACEKDSVDARSTCRGSSGACIGPGAYKGSYWQLSLQ